MVSYKCLFLAVTISSKIVVNKLVAVFIFFFYMAYNLADYLDILTFLYTVDSRYLDLAYLE